MNININIYLPVIPGIKERSGMFKEATIIINII
jgi:hypothetical protein